MRHPAESTRSIRCFRRLVGCALALAATAAGAQIPDEPAEGSGFDAGPLRFFPIVGLSYEHTDNVLYRSETDPDNVRPSDIFTGVGGAVMSIPVSNSDISLGVARRERSYSDDPDTGAWYGMASARLLFNRGHLLMLRDRYENGELDAQAFRGAIPGVPSSGEIVVTGEPYHRNSADAELQLAHGGRGRTGLRYENEIIRFTGDRESGFYDLDGHKLEVWGARAVGGGSYLLWSAEIARDQLERPDSPPPPGGGPPSFPADEARQRGISVKAGWQRGFGLGGQLTLKAGGVAVDSRSQSTFSYTGVVGSVEYLRDVPTRVFATAGYYRAVYPSPFSSADLFLSDSVVVRVARPAAARLMAGGEVSGTSNKYQSDGRTDDVVAVSGWVGWRWTRALTWRVVAAHTARTSTLEGFDFNVNRIGTTLEWGF